jgi:hypothetical protein
MILEHYQERIAMASEVLVTISKDEVERVRHSFAFLCATAFGGLVVQIFLPGYLSHST